MKKTLVKKVLSYLLLFVLIAAMALLATGCNDDTKTQSSMPEKTDTVSVTEVGKGDTVFSFEVVDVEGKTTAFKVYTDKKTVGEALVECELISGDDGPYGLYVKTVNGTTLDYDKDGKYWAFYENGEVAQIGVDMTEIVNGANYAFKAE